MTPARLWSINMTKILAAIVALSFFACAGKARIATAPPDPALEARLREASSLYARGAYVTLKKAFSIYEELYARPRLRSRVAPPFFRTCLLLAVRKKELSILDRTRTCLNTAEALLRENPSLAGFRDWLDVAAVVTPKARGVQTDIDTTFNWTKAFDRLRAAGETLRRRAAGDELWTYLFKAWECSFGPMADKAGDPDEIQKAFPSSILLKYKTAICGPWEDRKLLEEVAGAKPEFFEAYYNLGELSLREGKVLVAETDLLKAFEGIPDSPQVLILLATVYFATEEFEKGIEFYDRTLAVSPEYRDALLGKAICLAYLKRFDESIVVLDRIVALGYWLLGESHYWLAWNLHEMERDREALESIDQAKGRLPMNSEVFGLAGTIASGMGELVRAEKDFRESLQYNAQNSEALFGLGTICAKKERWPESGQWYEKALAAFEAGERTLRGRVQEIERSLLSPERKERLLRRKNAQIQAVLLSRASACYGAALSWLEAGDGAKAKELALKAAEHPSYKAKSEEILKKSAAGRVAVWVNGLSGTVPAPLQVL